MISVLLLILPLIGAVAIGFAPLRRAAMIAFVTSCVAFVLSVVLATNFDHWSDGGFSAPVGMAWLETMGVSLRLHADAVSMLLVLLTTLIMPLCIAGSFTAITHRIKEYYAWMLVIQAAMTGVFLARDLIFFYVCFEFTLVPMFFLIAIYGGDDRARASIKFFIYTFTGSMLTLAGLIYVAWQYQISAGAWSFDIPALTEFASNELSARQQGWVLIAMLAGFAVKVPLFPLHTWLPLAHTEAPTAGSVILAAVLLKLGTYGLYRFVLPMLPDAVVQYAPAIAVFAIIGIIYAGLICWVQSDVKKLIAYSSVSHLGFCVLGLVALNPMGVHGSVVYMLNHGLSTGALFLLIGMIYERYHTRDMNALGGLAKRMPVWAFFMVFFVLSSVGLPGLNGFIGEFLCLIGTFTATTTFDDQARGFLEVYPGVLGPWYAAFAGLGMIVAAMYLLIMVGKVVFGPLKEPSAASHDEHGTHLPADLTWREISILVPLAVLCVVIGFKPGVITKAIERPVEQVLAPYPERVLDQWRPPALIDLTQAAAEEAPVADLLCLLIPELILFTAAVVAAVMGLSRRKGIRDWLPGITCLALGLAGVATLVLYTDERVLAADLPMPMLGRFVKTVVCVVGIILTMVSVGLVDRRLEDDVAARRLSFDPLRASRGEYYAFFLLSLTGVMLCTSAKDLIWLFLALELTSLPTYIMVAMSRGSRRAQEASVKYFFLGAMAAAIFLYGFAMLYGATGTIVLSEMQAAFAEQKVLSGTINTIGTIGLILAILGVGFKIAAVPMHFYAPDVYEGAAAPVTAFLGFVPKTAGMLALILLLSTVGWGGWGGPGAQGTGWAILPPPILATLLMMSGLTMTLGNIGALLQKSVKRMLAYSSIAHSGYLMIGLIAGPGLGLSAVLFYLLVYGLMNTGAFAVLAGLERQGEEIESVEDLAGLRQRHKTMAWAMAICAGSLLGFPPLLGFIGKLLLLIAGMNADQVALVVVAVINSAISAWYYLRLVGLPILASPSARSETIVRAPASWRRVAAVICALAQLVLILPFFTQALLRGAGHQAAQAAVVETDDSGPIDMETALAEAGLLVELRDTHDPVRVGEEETYVVSVTNQGDRPDTNLRVVCRLESYQQFVRGEGPTSARESGGVITFEPLKWFDPGDTVRYTVVVRAVAAGDARFRASVNSSLTTRPVEESEATHHYE